MADDPVRAFVEDMEAAMVDVGLSHKAACIAMEIDPGQWTRMRSEGRIDSRRLASLGEDFQKAFTERRAARFGLRVEDDPDTDKAERLRKLLHALVDAVDVFPMVKAGLAEEAKRRSA